MISRLIGGVILGVFAAVLVLGGLADTYRAYVPDDIRPPIAESQNATVRVFTYNPEFPDKRLVECAGVYVGNGRVVTAGHCVSAAKDSKNRAVAVQSAFDARLDSVNRWIPARVEYATWDSKPNGLPHRDLALLSVNPNRITATEVDVRCSAPRVGDEVYTVGHPSKLNWFATFGHVATKWPREGEELWDAAYWLQMDLSVFYGNSGGPVFDRNGDVVGIVSHMITSGFGRAPTGHAFAASGSAVCSILESYRKIRPKAFARRSGGPMFPDVGA